MPCEERTACPSCDGAGEIAVYRYPGITEGERCDACNGTGEAPRAKAIRHGGIYEGRRGDRRYVVDIDSGRVDFVRGDRYDRRNAPDASITLRAFRRWAMKEVSANAE
jgi:hypothetical protein